jgi:Arc/MetJ-type ribon-helix-helix transcriptional regulator
LQYGEKVIPEFPEEICFRLSKEEKQRISQLIKEGKFKNKSQVIRAALKEFLMRQ